MAPSVDVIILTNTISKAHYEMTARCIKSYNVPLVNRIIVVETNKEWEWDTEDEYDYWDIEPGKIFDVCPELAFNYNQFLNIGLQSVVSKYVCISNNDVEAQPGCIENVVRHFEAVPDLYSVSPVDRSWHNNSYSLFPEDNAMYYGYTVTQHLLGFCIFARREIFDYKMIGPFDERFWFYHQDNDYSAMLERHGLKHALLTGSHIRHGHDKPETGVTSQETYADLAKSEAVFINKWSDPNTVKQYYTLSIVSNNQTDPVDKMIQVCKHTSDACGQYRIQADRNISKKEQVQLLTILKYKPTQLSVNRLIVQRVF